MKRDATYIDRPYEVIGDRFAGSESPVIAAGAVCPSCQVFSLQRNWAAEEATSVCCSNRFCLFNFHGECCPECDGALTFVECTSLMHLKMKCAAGHAWTATSLRLIDRNYTPDA
jgi:hypothetical protein